MGWTIYHNPFAAGYTNYQSTKPWFLAQIRCFTNICEILHTINCIFIIKRIIIV